VAVHASDLSLVGSWQVPASQALTDGDFGSTPTFFKATISGKLHQMVGLLNKNGIYYAFDRSNISAGPLWQDTLAQPAGSEAGGNNVASSAWDGTNLYAAAAITTINGKSCSGSLRALNPATGAFIWQDCFNTDIYSPVTMVPGLASVASGTSFYIVNAKTGKQLFSFQDTNSKSFFEGPSSISNGQLYQGNNDGYLYAFGT
jgi:polyvinyl alcohol dehydrogenase (cytochrome)